jgi:lipopolysaccharide transport system ATP-binding protein
MKRSEIQRLFDEIVAFAEVEQFIDTPVKRYSSGMYLRLAFAVAAFLQPELLVVDEVLAVGDAAFQKKCLGRMGEVARDGRTVLFVSHNMAAVRSLCQTGLVLERGQILTHGPVHEAIEQYLAESADQPDECTWPDLSTAPGNTQARLRAIRLLDRDGCPIREARLTEAFFIEIDYTVLEPGTLLLLSVSLHDRQGTWVLASPNLTDENWFQKEHPKGTFRSRCAIPGNLLNEGAYNVTVFLVGRGARIIARAEQAVTINLVDLGESRGTFFGQWGGVVRPQLSWQTSMLEPAPLGIAVASSHL